MHTNRHFRSVKCYSACSGRKFNDSYAFMFSDVLVGCGARLCEADLGHTWMNLPPVVCPHLILFSVLALAWIHAKTWLTSQLTSFTFFSPHVFLRHLAPLPQSLHCPPLLPAVPPPIVHFGNWVRAVALESLCNPHFISTLIEVQIQYSLISLLLAVPFPAPLR